MFASIGDILDGASGDARPAHDRQPIRRHSYAKGRCEGTFWRRVDRQEVRRIVFAAERYDIAGKLPGERNGPLGHVALQVLNLFANLVNDKTGRLDPSLDYLTAKLKRSKDAVVRALKALRAHGFLDWLRRYVPTGNEGRGPRVQQTSNAYRLSLPARAARLLPAAAPAPDDFTSAQARTEAGYTAYRASLSPAELAREIHGDTPLGDALARLGSLIQERESGGLSESQPSFLFFRD